MKKIATITGAAIFAAQGALAQNMVCGETDKIHGTLSEKYGESPIACGTVGNSDTLLQCHWQNSQSGTWTTVRDNIKEGVSCLLSSGNNAMIMPEATPEPAGLKI